ncbi:hypothetical protein [Peijinzhouia sedimentorum]
MIIENKLVNKVKILSFPITILTCLIGYSFFNDYRILLRFIGVPAEAIIFTDLKDTIEFAKNYFYGNLPIEEYGQLGFAWAPFVLIPIDWHIPLGILLGLTFFYIASLFPIKNGKIYFSLLLGSYVVIFAVERGQPDLLIFISCFFLIKLVQKNQTVFSTLLIIYLSLLKFFPASLFALLWNKKITRSLLITILGLSALAAGVLLEWDLFIETIAHQNRMFGGLTWKSFGSHGIFSLFNSINLWSIGAIPTIVGSILCILIFIMIGFFINNSDKNQNKSTKSIYFLVGSLLFLTTFMLGRNFDYKLVFLLFTIPFLLDTFYSENLKKERLLGTILLIAIFISFWSGLLGGDLLEGIRDQNLDNLVGQILRLYLNGFNVIKELLTWVIFAGLSYFTIQLLPPWFGQTLNLSIFRTK